MDAIKVTKVEQVRLNRLSHRFKKGPGGGEGEALTEEPSIGSLHLTTHHIIWKPSIESTPAARSPCQTVFDTTSNHEIWVAHALLAAIQHLRSYSQPTLLIRLITFVTYTLTFPSLSILEFVWDSLKGLLANRKQGDKESVYAFSLALPSIKPHIQLPGWDTYDPIQEFTRLKAIGPDETAWRITSINSDFNFCSSYPTTLLVPAKISDTTLSYAVKYRSKGRLPVGTYVHWANGSSITRSSQPMVGFKNARSIQDEKLIEAIFHSHSLHTGPRTSTIATPVIRPDQATQQIVYGATSTNLIIDARPTTNAMANTVKGAGTENMENYKGCRKAYLGIDNIHVMRDSLNKVVSALHESFVTGQPVSHEALRRSGWLKHISAVLDGTNQITRTVHVFNSHVLIHCSDGWDRTSQLSALSQICLDPFYRTFAGFAILIEKDWLSFGHKFSDRSGIVVSGKEMVSMGDGPPTSNSDEDIAEPSSSAWVASFQKQLSFGSSTGHSHAFKETSPIFHQFLDCVYQLECQFPTRFEFNSAYLQRLHEELYAGQYGTFLFDSEAERISAQAKSRTRSVWEIFEGDRSGYRNALYDASLDDPSRRTNEDQGVLLPDAKQVIFWWELFGVENSEMNPPKATLTAAGSSGGEPGVERASNSVPFPGGSSSRQKWVKERSDGSGRTAAGAGEWESRARANTEAQRLPTYLTAPLTSSRVRTSESEPSNMVNLGGEQIQAVIQTAKTMGWNTWDRFKRGYEEATKVPGREIGEWDEDRLRVAGEGAVDVEDADMGVGGYENPWRVREAQQESETRLTEANPWGTPVVAEVVGDPLRGVSNDKFDPLGVGLL